jgi:hypothetical protein
MPAMEGVCQKQIFLKQGVEPGWAERRSRQFYRPMIIAMAVMWVMQPSVHKVIDVITVRHLFVSAAQTMRMRAPGLKRAAHGVGIANLDNMFVDMIFMHVMQMTIVQIIDMVVMAYKGMPLGSIRPIEAAPSIARWRYYPLSWPSIKRRERIGPTILGRLVIRG